MQYHEFDESKLKNAADELTEIADKNISGKEKRVEELINIMFDEYDLQATLYNIRYNDFYTDVTLSLIHISLLPEQSPLQSLRPP